MTAQQAKTINSINDQLASERASAELNTRPALSGRELALNIYAAMMAAKQAGDITKARALAVELKPLLEWLD